ncbi:hypothetical protein AJ78_04042 [Emergomyces pasteurianus Ep9510]|uniref:RING-type domain-containing protein n=1 Tax=Emergomyces pasteurianus Ep9510 TaxID=1447872 RepID=A0A1J9Q662_9EURO|nr:hypothetical protein AJ78_04042 [Emergomyces pasteurianus Ep9510]
MPTTHHIYIPLSLGTLSVKELDQIEMQRSSGASIDQEDERGQTQDTDCILCFETLRRDMKFRKLPCQHIFHKPCIDAWLSERDARCPLCRQTFYHLKQPQRLTATPMDNLPSSNGFAVTNTLQSDQSLPPLPSPLPERGTAQQVTAHCRGPWGLFKWWRRRKRHRRRAEFDASQHPNAAAGGEYLGDGD